MVRKEYLIFPLITIILVAILASCSKRIHQADSNSPVLYPSPPDTARFQFLVRYGNSSDITGNQSKFKTFVVGQEEPLLIIKPYGLTLHKGKIFICDAALGGLQIIDLKKESLEFFTPGGRGKLKQPMNCFVDKEGNLYVADVERRQVVIFNEGLEYMGEIGGESDFKPSDVFITGDTILVTDPGNNRVSFYDLSSWQYLSSFPQEAELGSEEWLYNPLNLWVNKGKIYVTDFGNSRVKIFSMKGELLNSVGSYGRGLGQFVRPKGIAVDRDMNLFVVDAGFQNVQVFDKTGQLLMFFGGPYQGPGDMYLPANVTVDYDHLSYYEKYVDQAFKLKYLVFVTNQYGPDKVSVYGRVDPIE